MTEDSRPADTAAEAADSADAVGEASRSASSEASRSASASAQALPSASSEAARLAEPASEAPRLVEAEAEERPRPQYGEYATPEEQRARIQRPEVTEALDAGVAPQPPAPTPVPATAPAAAQGPLWDRALTFGLLVYGLVSTVSTIIQLLDFPSYAETAARILGADATFTNLPAGYVWGAAAAFVYGAGWLLTAVLTWRRLKRGRIAFWIPLVGFVATAILASICITIALFGDPQFMSALIASVPN